MIIRAIEANTGDAAAVSRLINKHELAVDSAASLMSESSAADFMMGYVDPSPTFLLYRESDREFSGVVNLHPDSVRSRYFVDVYSDPDLDYVTDFVAWAIQFAASQHPEWKMWPGMNSKDSRLRQAWESFGFSFLREYFTMRLKISDSPPVVFPTGLSIRKLDVASEEEVRLWHSLHQSSFAGHFGFAPRPYEMWRELVGKETSFDSEGVFVAEIENVAVGFCESSNEFEDENRGYIVSLGVVPEARGKGVGESLLRHAIAYSSQKGFSGVELNVDTGNESGALRLYEKVGFTAESSWIQLSNDNWSAEFRS